MTALEQLLATLERTPREWVAAEKLQALTGLHPRQIGELASASDGAILGSGAGYRLASFTPDEEIQRTYLCLLRRALATEFRARRIWARAKRSGRLTGDSETKHRQTRAELLRDIRAENLRLKAAAPAKPESYVQPNLL